MTSIAAVAVAAASKAGPDGSSGEVAVAAAASAAAIDVASALATAGSAPLSINRTVAGSKKKLAQQRMAAAKVTFGRLLTLEGRRNREPAGQLSDYCSAYWGQYRG